ncbi:MAG TPA: ABC transporter permease [Polyangiaceae bacterium]
MRATSQASRIDEPERTWGSSNTSRGRLGRIGFERGCLAVAGGGLGAFLLIPLLALVVTATPTDLLVGLRYSIVWPALRLSFVTTFVSAAIVFVLGTPLAWSMARANGRVSKLVESMVQLPIVVPPAVAGVALLLAFGRHGLLTGRLYPTTWAVSFSTAAVVMAEVFVSAPFFVQAATSAFRQIDESLIVVARSFSATPLRIFFRLALPLSAPGLAAGLAMSWARALGEFGATLMFAGNLEGKTQTLPLAIYTALEIDLRAAQAISVLLVTIALCLLVSVRFLLVRRANVKGTLA